MRTSSKRNKPDLIFTLNSLYSYTAIFSIIIILSLQESSRILEDFFDYQLKSENIFLYSETDLFTYQADVSTQGELPSCWRPTKSDWSDFSCLWRGKTSSNSTMSDRNGKNLYHGKYYPKSSKANPSDFSQQNPSCSARNRIQIIFSW